MKYHQYPRSGAAGPDRLPRRNCKLRRGAGDFHFCAGQRYGGRPPSFPGDPDGRSASPSQTEQDLYEIGTVCHVLQIITTSEDHGTGAWWRVQPRARLHRLWQTSPYLLANVELLEDAPYRSTSHRRRCCGRPTSIFGAYKELSPQMSDEVVAQVHGSA